MNKRKITQKIILMTLLGSMLLAVGCSTADSEKQGETATQSTQSEQNVKNEPPADAGDPSALKPEPRGEAGALEPVLAKLVEAGTFTEDEADKVLTYMKENHGRPGAGEKPMDPLTKMVDDGVISQEKVDKIKELMPMRAREGGPKDGEKVKIN